MPAAPLDGDEGGERRHADEQGIGSAVVLGPILVGVTAFAAFVAVERRSRHPMLPLDIFTSPQFTAANLVTFVVYAALGGVFFLLVVVLQTALGYSPLQAGAASLPVTLLMLVLSARAGELAQRIGPRVPLTLGPLIIAGGMLLMLRIGPGSPYLSEVLPAVLVFGAGLSLVVAPVTATVLAAADERHAGAASGVNNAVARTAQLAAVSVLPLVAGLSGEAYRNPQALTDAFHRAMVVAAALAVAGAVLSWLTISDDVLHAGEEPTDVAPADYHCAVDGTPLRPRPVPRPAAQRA
jgi:predicted MFS family arabinose efflux permease